MAEFKFEKEEPKKKSSKKKKEEVEETIAQEKEVKNKEKHGIWTSKINS